MLSKTFSLALGPFDTIVRWGGEAFVGVFPNTSLEKRTLVKHSWVTTNSHKINVSVSVGGTLAQPGPPRRCG